MYYFGVTANPLCHKSLVAVFPLVGQRYQAAIYVSFSWSGLTWSEPVPLLNSRSMQQGQRTADQPAVGLVLREAHIDFYVQHRVPGIASRADGPTGVVRYSVPLHQFRQLSYVSLCTLPSPMAGTDNSTTLS